MLCAFNLSSTGASYALPAGHTLQPALDTTSGAQARGNQIAFDPWGVLFARLA